MGNDNMGWANEHTTSQRVFIAYHLRERAFGAPLRYYYCGRIDGVDIWMPRKDFANKYVGSIPRHLEAHPELMT